MEVSTILLFCCMPHCITHGVHISAMDVTKAPVLFTVMLVGKIGMELIAEGCYALWICPNGDKTSGFTGRPTSKLTSFNDCYRM